MRFQKITLWLPKKLSLWEIYGTALGLCLIAKFIRPSTRCCGGERQRKGSHTGTIRMSCPLRKRSNWSQRTSVSRFSTKAGALRAQGNGITVRPLVDNELRVELYLASRADNRSKLVSQFARAFMRRIEQVLAPPQMILPLRESPIGPIEPTPGKHTPKSDHGVDAKPRFKRTAPKL